MLRNKIWRVGAVCIAMLLTASSCGDSSGSDEATSATTSGAAATTTAPAQVAEDRVTTVAGESTIDEQAQEVATESPTPSTTGGGVGGLDSLSPVDIGRDIVFTAQITVAVDDVAVGGQAALDAVAPLGGLLFGQQTRSEPTPRTVLVIKVLPEDFQEALRRLGGIGELRSQIVSAEDVTERIVDIASRITTSETSVERLRALLANAVVLDEIAALERELLNREQSLEQFRGQLRTLEDAVGLATITITIDQKVEPTPRPELAALVSFYVGDDDGRACPARATTRIDEGDIVTLCVEVTNTGDTALGEVQIGDRALELDEADFVRLNNSGSEFLDPGQTWLFTSTFTATTSRATETRVTSRPFTVPERGSANTAERQAIDADAASVVTFENVTVRPDPSLPGFTDAFGGAVNVLQFILSLLILVVGAAIPFLWIPLIAVGVWWIRRPKTTRRVRRLEPESVDTVE